MFGTIQNALDGLSAEDEPKGKIIKFMPKEVSVSLKNLSFSYPGEISGKVIKSINLEISAGAKVGIVGHSGSGKTTLIGILLGLYKQNTGEIKINGKSIERKDPSYIRDISSFVPQDANLFNRTVKDNVIYAKPNATNKQLIDALKQAEAFDFVQKLPKGIDTMIGERGVKLSGGQRQRIAIARAILKDAPLLLLDEATSALDSVSEQSIQKSLHRLIKKRTAIIIAHRLSTLKHLDKIIVLDQGKIVEHGIHKELVARDGIYADLWKRQRDGFIVD
jgi:ATP-binding cassette subfamily B protein